MFAIFVLAASQYYNNSLFKASLFKRHDVLFSRLFLDNLTGEWKQLEASVQKLEREVSSREPEVQNQFEKFIKVKQTSDYARLLFSFVIILIC